MLNFYGGPEGRSFSIAWIFATRFGSGNSMQADIGMGWKSPIAVGSYAIISYGPPNDKNGVYELYRDTDLREAPTGEQRLNYNSTLWQKVYDEGSKNNASNGITYKFISALAGNTPKLEFLTPIDVLDADQKPEIVFYPDPDNPQVLLRLPQSQVLSLNQPIEILDADRDPYVIYDDGSRDPETGEIVVGAHGGTINRPTLSMGLPQSQRIQLGTITWIKANENPRIELDATDINKPVLKFWLPVAQQLQQGETTILDADEEPYFEIDSSDPDKPVLKFWLPQSQIMQDPTTKVIGPDQAPSVSLDDSDINKLKLDFELPRAVRFYYGTMLGERQAGTYRETSDAFADYGIGDYYINSRTGFIYKVIAIDGTTCTFLYVASIQQPLPSVSTVGISPYTAAGEQNTPKVTRMFTNNEQTAWQLEFELPKIPKPTVTSDFVGSLEEGEASVAITGTDTINFDFKIPTGSRMFAGTEVDSGKYDTVVPEARPGDLYLNADTGMLYILQSSGIWEIQQGSLKGPVGDALHIVRDYRIEEEDTFAAGRDYILDNYKDSEGQPIPLRPDEIFAVTFIDTELEKETSYWYFYTEEGQWGRVQLTGGVMNLIENTWQESTPENPITNKTYSIDYINKLIGGKIDNDNKDRTAFSKDQIYKLLSWGTWDDAKLELDIPEAENHDTLSAAEVIELMSWKSFISLIVR